MAYRKRSMARKTAKPEEEFEKRQTQIKEEEMKSLLEACKKFAQTYSMSPSLISIFNLYLMDITLYKLFAHKDLNCCWSDKVEICKSHLIPKSVLELIRCRNSKTGAVSFLSILLHRKMRLVVLILELCRVWRYLLVSGQAREKTEENAL